MIKIEQPTPVLNDDGTVGQTGYCFRNYYVFNKSKVHCREERFKEWEFYQFYQDDWVMQLTVGHATLFDNFGFNFFNVKTGKRYECSKLRLHRKKGICYPNPESSHQIGYDGKNFSVRFKNEDGKRMLSFNANTKQYGKVSCRVQVFGKTENDKMVILTPFDQSKYMFYLNYKENYYDATGEVTVGDQTFRFDKLFGLVDSGRGYWPFKQEWVWSSLTTKQDGVNFGWNLGWGFGNLSNATENVVFWDGKGMQLGKIQCNADFSSPSTSVVTVCDRDGKFRATLTPVFDNYTHTDFLYVHNKCHQVYYDATGEVNFDGKEIKFENVRCFLEHAVNQW